MPASSDPSFDNAVAGAPTGIGHDVTPLQEENEDPHSPSAEEHGSSSAMARGGSKSDKVARFSVSLPADLLDELDAMVESRKFPNRSHAIADMAREKLLEHAQELGTNTMAGTISLVYDYRKRNLQRQLADIQHANYLMIVATMHVHLEHHQYLEVLLVQGPARELRRLADTLAGTKGVIHAKLHLTATAIPPLL